MSTSAGRVLPSPTATPLATVMVLLLLLAALMLHLYPGDVSTVVAWTSTNVHNLSDHPVAAMVSSTFVVPGNLMPNLAIVAVSFAVLERAIGPWRTALIALSGQVVATLLTEYGIELGAHWHLLAESSTERPDVGVSYVMYAVLVAATMSLHGPGKILGVLIIGVNVLYPFIMSPGMTPTGHVLSVAVGAAGMTSIGRSVHRRTATSNPRRETHAGAPNEPVDTQDGRATARSRSAARVSERSRTLIGHTSVIQDDWTGAARYLRDIW